jgi:hypothetical protein
VTRPETRPVTRPFLLAGIGLALGLFAIGQASAQLMGARELTAEAAVKGAPASKPTPDLYFLVGESGAKETYTLAVKGKASISLFTPDGHEMVTATGSGKVTLTAVLNLTDVFTLAVSREMPGQSYTLSRKTTLPTLAEAEQAAYVGYTLKTSRGDFSQCWITPGVKYRTKSPEETVEHTLAADRNTVSGVGLKGTETASFERSYELVGDQLRTTYRWPSGETRESTSDLRRPSLDDGRTREFTGYMCEGYERPGRQNADEGEQGTAPATDAARERAIRKAAEEAEYQAKQKAYEDGVAAHEAAVEQYRKALADTEAQKAAAATQAKAAQDAFARKQADYEAELARARNAREEYEAKYGKPDATSH